MRPMLVLALAVALGSPAAAASAAQTAGFDAACHAAMARYYAALVTSAHGNSEATQRQLLLLKARWEDVTLASQSDGPEWARDLGPAGQSSLAAAAAMIDRARQRAAVKDIAGAHAELEGVRVVLRDARARRGVRTFDDALTDYHDAMERLTNRVGLRNEIALNAEDYAAIREQTSRATAAWAEIESIAGPVKTLTGWRELAGRTTSALAALKKSASAQDAAAAQDTAEVLKTQYFALLEILARG